MTRVIIIESGRTNQQAIIELASRHMERLFDCTDISFAQVEEIKEISKYFVFTGTIAENTKKSLEELIEAMKDVKPKELFDPQPSKYISKPKNNYKKR